MSRWPPPRERLFSRLVPCPDPGCECLLWTGACSRGGYGQIRFGGRACYVHRVMWEMFEGPIPDGLQLDHVKARGCTHKNCANVAHLEPVTNLENSLRGQTMIVINAAKTHCKHGHEFTPENTHMTPDGWRWCRLCAADRSRQYRRNQARQRELQRLP